MGEKRKVIVDGTELEVEVELEGGLYKATVEGRTFEVSLPDVGAAPSKRSRSTASGKKSGTISANIPGKVVTIEVSEGDEVEEGQMVLILEAMKMQNEMSAPISGTVESINCGEGQSIEANVPLMVIKPFENED